MGQVVHDITQDTATVHRCGNIPVPKKDGMRQLPERRGQRQEQRRGHNQAEFVHGQIMVDSMQQKVRCDHEPVIGHFSASGHVSTIQKQNSGGYQRTHPNETGTDA